LFDETYAISIPEKKADSSKQSKIIAISIENYCRFLYLL